MRTKFSNTHRLQDKPSGTSVKKISTKLTVRGAFILLLVGVITVILAAGYLHYRLQTWMIMCVVGALAVFQLFVADALDRQRRLNSARRELALQKQRAEAEAANQRLMVAIDQAMESILFTDINGTILYVNQGFEKATGFTRQEVIGQNPRVLKSGKHPSEYYKAMWDTINRGEVWQGRFINRRKDQTFFEEEVTISPIRDVLGQVTSFVAVKRDITREVQLERQLIEAQKMDSIGQLAGGVAHDYNNILASLVLQLGIILTEPDLSSEVRETLESVKGSVDRATRLTRQLLMFSRRQAMEKRPVELNALLDDELKMLRRLLGEHIELTIRPQSGDVWVEADPGMIEQVIMNLCINARDAMPKGGRLTVGIELVDIDATTHAHIEARTGKYARLSVTDVGCGMSEEIISRIFEPFFTTKEVGKGTGLGLATVYGIVKQHGGWIEVTSEVGKGSEFRIFLPASAAAPLPAATDATPKILTGRETILVVEDEASLRKPVVKWLSLAGYQVFEAEDGPAALQVWRNRDGDLDLLLTDMVMPGGMNGLELAEALLQMKPRLPVILMSGYSNELVQADIQNRPGFIFLAKPCAAEILNRTVRQSLDQIKA